MDHPISSKMNNRQMLRADFMSQLLARNTGTVFEAMLMCDAIVDYIEKGWIPDMSAGDFIRAELGRSAQSARA